MWCIVYSIVDLVTFGVQLYPLFVYTSRIRDTRLFVRFHLISPFCDASFD